MIDDRSAAGLVALATLIAVKVVDRLLDWWFPTNHHSRRFTRDAEDDTEDDNETT